VLLRKSHRLTAIEEGIKRDALLTAQTSGGLGCKTQILALDWVTRGSLSQSPQGNWRWTRKVKAKTVTVALSDQQAELFRRAIFAPFNPGLNSSAPSASGQ